MQPEGPFFNLKAVVQQTGLKPDTLRAWERRYGVPTPRRSGGGHRLYTRRDIQAIKWLMARQEEGLSIKHAVEVWQQIEAEGEDPLQTMGPITPVSPPSFRGQSLGETLLQLREDWGEACLAYDEQRAEQVLSQAFAIYSPETVLLEVVRPAIAQIGDGWYRGEVTVQQEHFASALAFRRLEALVAATPPPTRLGRILAACPPHEHHEFGLLLLTYLLRRRGWEVVYLGADVPVERLEITVAKTRPKLVILAAQQLHTAATLLETGNQLQSVRVPVAYGGLVFNLLPAIRRRMPGHFMGEALDVAVLTVETLMSTSRPLPSAEPVPEVFLQARDHYAERRWLIESELGQPLNRAGIVPTHLSMANREMERNINAALSLGDLNLIGTDITWLDGLMANHQVPADQLWLYLDAYYQAARRTMDQRGDPIVDWLGLLVRNQPEVHRGRV